MPLYRKPVSGQQGSTSISAASLSFTDGDTLKRFTISDATVSTTSKIVGSVRRPDSADDSVDEGYIYTWSLVEVATGSFDILVAVHDGGYQDCTGNPPNETVTFWYIVA